MPMVGIAPADAAKRVDRHCQRRWRDAVL